MSPPGGAVVATYTMPSVPLAAFQNSVLPGSVDHDRGLLLGSIGSDLWRAPSDPHGQFWMVSDRGPNAIAQVNGLKRRIFPVPEFDPVIVHVQAQGEAFRLLDVLPVTDQSGRPVSGLSNVPGRDEPLFDWSGQTQWPFNPSGLDTEGLVRSSTGDFWLVEEYSPSIVQVDRAGRVVTRWIPRDLDLTAADYPTESILPAILSKRRLNRGFEGIALSPDEKTLYVVLQSPLANPDKATGEASRNCRVLAFDLASRRLVAESVYRLEVASEFAPNATPADLSISALVAVNPTTLLVLERTDAVAKLYSVDLSAASNILGTEWDDPAHSPSLEALAELEASGIKPLPKTLTVDLATLPGIPSKLEGVALIDRQTVAFSNDNDFAFTGFEADGRPVATDNPNRILFVRLANRLP